MIKILVTGASGQLGSCIRDLANSYADHEWTFLSKNELAITEADHVKLVLQNGAFDYCINTSGYTNVEQAEKDSENAFLLNAEALIQLSESSGQNNTTLIHLSTDYVFDGKKQAAYVEVDAVHPLNNYGASKLKGEQIIEKSECNYFIIRTSWLYSEYRDNFLKTVLRMVGEGKKLTVTTEQTGTPTNANDLAQAIMTIIESKSQDFGRYHFSNSGEATWFDFAEAILENTKQLEESVLEKTAHYATFAERPKYSVLDCTLYQQTFEAEISNWKTSLKSLLLANKNNIVSKKNI
jgi:dTDP-4-dehydrorhamnose reductase